MNIMNAQFNLHEFYVLSFRVIKTMISPKRVNNIFAAFKSLKTRKDHVPGMPSVMMVEPSAICNMQCPVCALYVQPIRKPSFLDFELYKKILNELESSVIILTLWNWGEPLLNPEIGSMVALATKKKILTSITTNGMELKGKIAEELISGGLCHLVVSLDSASPEVYNKLRGYGFFNEIISNVSDFITIRNRKRSKLPLVELKMLVTRDNENEIEEFKNLKFITGVDRIRFRRLVWAHNPELIEKAPTISSFRMPHGIIKN
jgi:MoaA/NifB/PqqE/SkfB family radical SAM enzyme